MGTCPHCLAPARRFLALARADPSAGPVPPLPASFAAKHSGASGAG